MLLYSYVIGLLLCAYGRCDKKYVNTYDDNEYNYNDGHPCPYLESLSPLPAGVQYVASLCKCDNFKATGFSKPSSDCILQLEKMCPNKEYTCFNSEDCLRTQFCSNSRCKAKGRVGGQCTKERECLDGLLCVDNVCIEDGKRIQTCKVDSDCDSSSYCNFGRCAPKVSVDNVCSRDAECVNGYFCYLGLCRQRKGLWSTCENSSECPGTSLCTTTPACKVRRCVCYSGNCDTESNVFPWVFGVLFIGGLIAVLVYSFVKTDS